MQDERTIWKFSVRPTALGALTMQVNWTRLSVLPALHVLTVVETMLIGVARLVEIAGSGPAPPVEELSTGWGAQRTTPADPPLSFEPPEEFPPQHGLFPPPQHGLFPAPQHGFVLLPPGPR
jgi:hypothetical protein